MKYPDRLRGNRQKITAAAVAAGLAATGAVVGLNQSHEGGSHTTTPKTEEVLTPTGTIAVDTFHQPQTSTQESPAPAPDSTQPQPGDIAVDTFHQPPQNK